MPSKKCQILAVFRARGLVGRKVLIFTAKGTSVCEYTSFKSFCTKIGWGSNLQVGWGKIKLQISYISHIYPEAPADPIITKFGLGEISGM